MEEDLFDSSLLNFDFGSTAATMDFSDEETDPGLRDLIDQRKRLVAELAETGDLVVHDDSQTTEMTELIDRNGPASAPEPVEGDGLVFTAVKDSVPAFIKESFCQSEQAPTADQFGPGPGPGSGPGLTQPGLTDSVNDYAMDSQTADEMDGNNLLLSDDDFDDDEVDKLLEESLATTRTSSCPSRHQVDDRFEGLSQPPAVKTKVVMKHRGMEYFEVLPDGWIEVTHSSGVPVFLHKSTRVCTLSRPYFLGPGSVRNHEVPMSAIPCYYQRRIRELEAEKEKQKQNGQLEVDEASCTDKKDGTSLPNTPKVKVQTSDDFKKSNLTPSQLHDYCTAAFDFETINVMRFKSWSDHRAYRKQQKQQHLMQANSTPVQSGGDSSGRPTLPANVKLITVPELERGSKPQQKPFFLNPQGRTSIAVLHEYVQKVMKGVVSYEFTETRNAASPYCATVRIATHDRKRPGETSGNKNSEPVWTEYGRGEGNSKKNAKLNAAKQAMRVLVPGIEFNADGVADLPQQDDAGQLFDLIKITDSRVPELSAKAGQPTPFVILQECLKRHSSFGDTTIVMDIQRIKHQQHEFTMKVAKHEVKVQCTNKKEGKQRAAQAMLAKLHPQITTWGSLIRLYGYGAQRKLQENRKEKDSIIRLQVQNRKQDQVGDEPNVAILSKLKEEMLKLYQQHSPDGGTGAGVAGTSSSAHFSAVKNIDI